MFDFFDSPFGIARAFDTKHQPYNCIFVTDQVKISIKNAHNDVCVTRFEMIVICVPTAYPILSVLLFAMYFYAYAHVVHDRSNDISLLRFEGYETLKEGVWMGYMILNTPEKRSNGIFGKLICMINHTKCHDHIHTHTHCQLQPNAITFYNAIIHLFILSLITISNIKPDNSINWHAVFTYTLIFDISAKIIAFNWIIKWLISFWSNWINEWLTFLFWTINDTTKRGVPCSIFLVCFFFQRKTRRLCWKVFAQAKKIFQEFLVNQCANTVSCDEMQSDDQRVKLSKVIDLTTS